jgi:hypothetical protein
MAGVAIGIDYQERHLKQIICTGLAITLILLSSGCTLVIPNETPGNPAIATVTSTHTGGAKPEWGVQRKTTGCQVNGRLQDSDCTPGDIIQGVTKDQVCQPGYARGVRSVTTSTKNKVFASYGVISRLAGEYEVDHLVSLELGGSNEISNLWPEAAEPTPGFHEKDQVENYLHDQMCSGAISLEEAQIQIATNWLAVYQSMPKK